MSDSYKVYASREYVDDAIARANNVITESEIDAICGGVLTVDITENALIDTATGITYRIYVEDGKLRMQEIEESVSTTSLVFVDAVTDDVYNVYVENGKLHMMEVE